MGSFATPKEFANALYMWTDFKLWEHVDLSGPIGAAYIEAIIYIEAQGDAFLNQAVDAAVKEAPKSEPLRRVAEALGLEVMPAPIVLVEPMPGRRVLDRLRTPHKRESSAPPAKRNDLRTIRLQLQLSEKDEEVRVSAMRLADGEEDSSSDPVIGNSPYPQRLLAEVAKVEAAILTATETRGFGVSTSGADIKASLRELGQDILKLVMPDPVLALYRDCQHEISRWQPTTPGGGRGSIVLEIEASNAPRLAAIPWELAFDGFQGGRQGHLCLWQDMPLRRTVPAPVSFYQMSRPVRVLGLIANPRLAGLDVVSSAASFAEEQEMVRQSLKEPLDRRTVTLDWVPGSSRRR